MKSLAFPNILDRSSVNTVTDLEATKSNLKLLLLSDFGTLIGDPNYGTGLKKLYFEQNNVTLKDIVIDTVYTSVAHFMPQIKVKRKDITIIQTENKLTINIKAKNMLDYTTNLYSIELTSEELI